MKEQQIEAALKAGIEAMGGLCWKLVCPGVAGVPDRICLMGSRVVFVEVKAPGEKPRPIQTRRIQQLRDQGFEVVVLDSLGGIGVVADALRAS